jgi:hypothetical protein
MLWETEPLPEVSERLKRLGIESAICGPRASAPDASRDFMRVMDANTRSLEAACKRS